MATKVALLSRLDFGSPGFRLGLLKLAAQLIEKEGCHFVVLAGGLTSVSAMNADIKVGLKRFVKRDEKSKFEEDFVDEAVDFLSKNFPTIKSPEASKNTKIFIVTSPAYDGQLGNLIAARLASKRRHDIVHENHGNAVFDLRIKGRKLAILTPEKATWMRGKYQSTAIQRVLDDWSRIPQGDDITLAGIGCFASDIQKPGGGESALPFFSIPALCHLWQTKVGTESQVGLTILTCEDSGVVTTKSISFNDLLVDERDGISSPPGTSANQKKVVKVLKNEGALTVGQIARRINRTRPSVREALKDLKGSAASKIWPGLIHDETSGKFDFDPIWLKNSLTYNFDQTGLINNRFLSFGCLHAGCVHTKVNWFVKVVPQIILERDINYLVGAGDFVEGTKHNLLVKGEIIDGINNTVQEDYAAYLVSEVMLKVFRARLAARFAAKKPKHSEILNLINEALVQFIYIPGNHCCWIQEAGVNPLNTFRKSLIERLREEISGILKEFVPGFNLNYSDLSSLVIRKVLRVKEDEPLALPSGVKLQVVHPYMGRALTYSARPEQTLGFASGSNLVISANFHVALALSKYQWQGRVGERIEMQLGTIKEKSGFETHLLKHLDTGVGVLDIQSRDGRIVARDTTFYTAPKSDDTLVNRKVFESFLKASASGSF